MAKMVDEFACERRVIVVGVATGHEVFGPLQIGPLRRL